MRSVVHPRILVPCVLLLLRTATEGAGLASDPAFPGKGNRPVLFAGDAEIARLKDNVARREEPFATAWQRTQTAARAALTASPPPPYAGKDSVELLSAATAATGAMRDLLLAWHVTGEAAYGRQARELFMSWAAHEPMTGTTLVNQKGRPQIHPGSELEGLGLNLGRIATQFAHVYSLAWPLLNDTDKAVARKWFLYLAGRILEGHRAWIDNGYFGDQRFNNHLTGHDMGLAAIGFATGERTWVTYALDSPENPADYKEMLRGTVIVPGVPLEKQLWRGDPTLTGKAVAPAPGEVYDRYRIVTIRKGKGCGLPYAMLHQKMLTEIAEMAFQNGIDLYAHTGPEGQNLRQTYRYYAPFFVHKRTDIQGGYYANNLLHLNLLHMYEIARLRFPKTMEIDRALAACDRAVSDGSLFGYSAVLTHGTPLDSGERAAPPRREGGSHP